MVQQEIRKKAYDVRKRNYNFLLQWYIPRKSVQPYTSSQYGEEHLGIYFTIIITFTIFRVLHLKLVHITSEHNSIKHRKLENINKLCDFLCLIQSGVCPVAISTTCYVLHSLHHLSHILLYLFFINSQKYSKSIYPKIKFVKGHHSRGWSW